MKSITQHGHVDKNSFSVEMSCEMRTDFENIRDNEKGLHIYYIDLHLYNKYAIRFPQTYSY